MWGVREPVVPLFATLSLQVCCVPLVGVQEVDVVISGGGMKGYFVTGAFAVLGGLHSIRVARISGASAGAWYGFGERVSLLAHSPRRCANVAVDVMGCVSCPCLRCAVFMTCGLHPVDWADTYYTTRLCIRDGRVEIGFSCPATRVFSKARSCLFKRHSLCGWNVLACRVRLCACACACKRVRARARKEKS